MHWAYCMRYSADIQLSISCQVSDLVLKIALILIFLFVNRIRFQFYLKKKKERKKKEMSLVTSESLPQLLVIKNILGLENEIVATDRSLHYASPFPPFSFLKAGTH